MKKNNLLIESRHAYIFVKYKSIKFRILENLLIFINFVFDKWSFMK